MIINKNVINTKKYANGTPEMSHGFEINHGVFELEMERRELRNVLK